MPVSTLVPDDRVPAVDTAELATASASFPTPLTSGAARAAERGTRPALAWLIVAAVVALSTSVCWFGRARLSLAEHVMIYLLGVLLMAARLPRRHAIVGCLASVAAFDFFFVPPVFGFRPNDVAGAMALATFLATSLVVSGYATRVRAVADATREQERRTAALYALSRALSNAGHATSVADVAAQHVRDLFDAPTRIRPDVGSDAAEAPTADSRRIEVPLEGARGRHGVLEITFDRTAPPPTAIQRQMLDTFAALIAAALERVSLVRAADDARLAVETERARNTLLSAVSHDLRTPLASIAGAAGALLAPGPKLTAEGRVDLLVAIREESDRLGRLVTNLLDLARVEAGAFAGRREWCPIDEVVGSVLERMRSRLEGRAVTLDLPADILEICVEGLLLEQVVLNLLENAAKHTPPGSPIDIVVRVEAHEAIVEILDRGPGVPLPELDRIFEAYRRVSTAEGSAGAGIGLALCRAIVRAHGGRIVAANRPGGGAVFRVSLPQAITRVLPAEEERPSSEGGA